MNTVNFGARSAADSNHHDREARLAAIRSVPLTNQTVKQHVFESVDACACKSNACIDRWHHINIETGDKVVESLSLPFSSRLTAFSLGST
jgi:hypothetical protein